MDHIITRLPKSQVEIQVTLPFTEFEQHVKRAAVVMSEENEIDGFRRGKAPYDAVKKKFGEHAIYEQAAERAVRKTYPVIVEKLATIPPQGKKEFVPIDSPEIIITKLAAGNEFIYKAKLSYTPDVELPDYALLAKELNKEKKEVSVSDEEIEKTLEWIRESRVQLIPVERAAEQGDNVEIDFEIRHNGVKWENGDSRNHPLVIGKGNFLPGFEENLIDMKPGEEKTFSLAIPESWHDKALAGKTINAHVIMRSVKQRKIPELTQDFVKQLSTLESVDAFRKNVYDGLLQEKKEKEQQRVRVLIIELIAKKITSDIPEVLIERELEKMFDELKTGVEQMGMKWEDYLLHIKKSVEELRNEWYEQATMRVRVALTLREIANREHIQPTKEEITARSNEFLRQYKSPEHALKQIDPDRLQEYTIGILKNEKVFEFLEAQ